MGHIDAVEASLILECDPSTVRKYAGRGRLPREKSGRKLLFPREDVAILQRSRNIRRTLGDLVKEAFVLQIEGAEMRALSRYLYISQQDLGLALGAYNDERCLYLNGAASELLLPSELAARLKSRSKMAVYGLVNDGRLAVAPEANGQRLITPDSWLAYIDVRAGKPLFTLSEAIQVLIERGNHLPSMPVIYATISKYNIGMKIRESPMSSYLFTQQDIKRLEQRL